MARIRPAEPRDLSAIEAMFLLLVDFLQRHGQTLYARDPKRLKNGIMGYIIGKMYHDDSLILVDVNQEDRPLGFLIGGLRPMEAFFEYDLVGEVQWTYPLNLRTRQLVREFEDWARGKGAQASSNYQTPGNTLSGEAFKHDGRKMVWNYWLKPLESKEEVTHGHADGQL